MANRKRVWRGWQPESWTIFDLMERAIIKRYPVELRRDCVKYNGKDCKPRKVRVTIADNLIMAELL